MRYVDLQTFIKAREKLSFRVSLMYSVPVGAILFLLTLSSGFFEALIFGMISGGIVFSVIFLLRRFTHKGVERKRNKTQLDMQHFDVTLKGEMGVLSILDDSLHYVGLTPGGATKKYSVDINEHLFLSVGELKQSRIRTLKYGDLSEGYILAKPMPNGIPVQFLFFNLDGLLETVTKRIEEVNKYKAE